MGRHVFLLGTLLFPAFLNADSTAPAPPQNLEAFAGDGMVSLYWYDNVEGDLASYSLYRSTTSGTHSGSSAFVTGLTASGHLAGGGRRD